MKLLLLGKHSVSFLWKWVHPGLTHFSTEGLTLIGWLVKAWTLRLISGGLGLQQLGVGFGFPARDWAGSQQWEHQVLATGPGVSDKGPGPSALWKRISTKTKSSEASKVFIKRKRVQYVWVGTPGDSEGESWSPPSGSLNYSYGVFLPGFLWLVNLICLVHSPYLVYLKILPCVLTHLLAKTDFTEKVSG